MHSLYAFALFASLCSASIFGGTAQYCKNHRNSEFCVQAYLDTVCNPVDSAGKSNLDAPCNIGAALLSECTYGTNVKNATENFDLQKGTAVSNNTQRLCICESQFWNAVEGCNTCWKAHGGVNVDGYTPPEVVSSVSSGYCAASTTPTLGAEEYLFSIAMSVMTSQTALKTSTFSDPIGNKTDVSLYYTPAVTGSAALDIGAFTGKATQTTIEIKNGQIVATASTSAPTTAITKAATTAKPQTGTSQGSTTSTGGSGARQTEAAFAGILGLVGVVAML